VMATFATLFFVPVVFSLMHRKATVLITNESNQPAPSHDTLPAPAHA